MLINPCIICLTATEDLKTINEVNKDDVEIITDLRKIVPEVDWQSDFKICLLCLKQLETVCAFRQLCIKSYNTWRLRQSEYQSTKSASSAPPKRGPHSFICYHCNRAFKFKKVLAKHIREKHQVGVEQTETIEVIISPDNSCSLCGTCFSTKYLLKRHQRSVHATEKRFKCELCDRKFASPVYLSAHKRYHSGERKHICSFCGKGYITASDLYHHEKIHANKRAYRCEICPKAFNTSSDLHKHKICVHLDRNLWKYECNYCKRKFPLKTNLDTHLKIHTGERNFLCHLCEKKCINKSVLKRHIDSHTVEKLFKCTVCLQSYKYKKSLDLHLAKQHGLGDLRLLEKVKRFACDFCTKSYLSNGKLQKHLRTHTKEECTKTLFDV